MSLLDKAILIAAKVHEGQEDKYGRPYILHPLRVMMRVNTDIEKIVAILHDVIEDSELNLQDLEQEGFSPEVIEAVDRLTKREGEAYAQYIDRIKDHRLARTVKLADLEDNMNMQRADNFEEEDFQRFSKYHNAWIILKNIR